jgi:hypothetical protein
VVKAGERACVRGARGGGAPVYLYSPPSVSMVRPPRNFPRNRVGTGSAGSGQWWVRRSGQHAPRAAVGWCCRTRSSTKKGNKALAGVKPAVAGDDHGWD